ncbi:rod-binding protein [Thalassospiraceae bacterium LMO-JJ14]|nr:rod-binding protein [Thalassospiraceae bacterium LMO-JJ14]
MSGYSTPDIGMQISAARFAQGAAPASPNAHNMQRMRETAEDFESVFLAEMLRPMFSNIEAASPFGGGAGEKIYRDMQVDEYGKALAKAGGIGLADSIMREMIKMQEGK